MRRSLSVSELSPGEFAARLDQLIAVYAAAMRPPAELLPGRKSIMAGHAANPGFRGAPGQWWHNTVRNALTASRGAAVASGWMDDSFEVAELHVAPAHQGQGTGADVLGRLASGRPERTALLSTRDADSPARRLYRGTGFVDLLTEFQFFPSSEPPYAVMGAELPLRNRSPRRSGWPRSPRPASPRPSR
jgi:ribosomal protein S18 acetylase RimI-like enzyme